MSRTSAHISVQRCEKVWNNSLGEWRKKECKRCSLTQGARVVSRCRPQLVGEEWHSSCQGPFEGIEAVDWSEVFVTHKKVGGNGGKLKCGNTVTVLWALAARKDGGDSYYDPSNKCWPLTRAQSKQNARKEMGSVAGRGPQKMSRTLPG